MRADGFSSDEGEASSSDDGLEDDVENDSEDDSDDDSDVEGGASLG